MIIWIASYPKSGNTWIRLFLKSYFSDENQELNINDETSIPSFPEPKYFDLLNIDFTKVTELVKNWNLIQDHINLNGETNFLKTHNGMFKINDYKFTDSKNTKGAIYIVRDPRDIAISYSNHFGRSHEETVNSMLNPQNVEKMEYKNKIYTHSIMGKWSDNYNSWKSYNLTKILIIKYEDLIKEPQNSFLKILEYLKDKNNLKINLKKMNKAIDDTNFNNLKKKEENYGFKEKSIHGRFFRKGVIGEWKYSLDKELVKKIEKAFNHEMKELGYL